MKKGYKQTVEHIQKRKRLGYANHLWRGDDITVKSGRTRALRMYPIIPPCVKCGNPKSERHHIDGNTINNLPENIISVCRKCHMKSDGRYEAFRELAIANQPIGQKLAAAANRAKTYCPKGHPYAGHNLYISPKGSRSCRQCLNEYKREKRKHAHS